MVRQRACEPVDAALAAGAGPRAILTTKAILTTWKLIFRQRACELVDAALAAADPELVKRRY